MHREIEGARESAGADCHFDVRRNLIGEANFIDLPNTHRSESVSTDFDVCSLGIDPVARWIAPDYLDHSFELSPPNRFLLTS
jgi:hypothetical protein